MRLTHLTEQADKRKNKEPMLKIRNKLFELENIEEELGIDLITLFKALKKGVYYRNTQKEINHAKNIRLSFAYKTLVVDYRTYKYLCDYGKTWALTKEELLWKV